MSEARVQYLHVTSAPVDAGRGLGGRLIDATPVSAEVRLVADDDDRRSLVAVLLGDDLVPQQLDLVEGRFVVDAVDEDERVAGADRQLTHRRKLVRTCQTPSSLHCDKTMREL